MKTETHEDKADQPFHRSQVRPLCGVRISSIRFSFGEQRRTEKLFVLPSNSWIVIVMNTTNSNVEQKSTARHPAHISNELTQDTNQMKRDMSHQTTAVRPFTSAMLCQRVIAVPMLSATYFTGNNSYSLMRVCLCRKEMNGIVQQQTTRNGLKIWRRKIRMFDFVCVCEWKWTHAADSSFVFVSIECLSLVS